MSRAEERIQRARNLAQTRQERALTKSRSNGSVAVPSFLTKAQHVKFSPSNPPPPKHAPLKRERVIRTGPQRGLPGKPGKDGRDGRDGVDGKDGRDGVDGIGAQGLQGRQGDQGPPGPATELNKETHLALHRAAPLETMGQGGGRPGGGGMAWAGGKPKTGDLLIRNAKGQWSLVPKAVLLAEALATPTTTLIDEALPFTYYGFATPGSLTADPVWRILRGEDLGDGDSAYLYADGDDSFDNVWDDRATTISYS